MAALEVMTGTWARELAERAIIIAINPGPANTDMRDNSSPEFYIHVRPWTQHTPGSIVRHDVDDEELVKDTENAGGRPPYANKIRGIVGMRCTADNLWCTGQVVRASGGLRMAI